MKYVTELFRPDITAALKTRFEKREPGFKELQPTIELLEVFGKWITIHDVSNCSEHITQRLSTKKPFYLSNHEWLTRATTDFIEILDDWRVDMLQRVAEATDKEEKQIQQQFLTNEYMLH